MLSSGFAAGDDDSTSASALSAPGSPAFTCRLLCEEARRTSPLPPAAAATTATAAATTPTSAGSRRWDRLRMLALTKRGGGSGGVGLVVRGTTVQRVVPGSAAEAAGVKVGMRVVSVNAQRLAGGAPDVDAQVQAALAAAPAEFAMTVDCAGVAKAAAATAASATAASVSSEEEGSSCNPPSPRTPNGDSSPHTEAMAGHGGGCVGGGGGGGGVPLLSFASARSSSSSGGPGTPELVAAAAATPAAVSTAAAAAADGDDDRAELLARLSTAEQQRDALAESHRAVLEALGGCGAAAGGGDDKAAAAAALCAARQQHEELGRLRLALRHERRGSARQLKEAERREADGGALREELRAREAEEVRLVAALAEAKARNAWADAVLDRLGVGRGGRGGLGSGGGVGLGGGKMPDADLVASVVRLRRHTVVLEEEDGGDGGGVL